MLSLHTLPPTPTRRRKKRLGRGNASGLGTTAGRGTKGQRARTGGRKHIRRRAMKQLILHLPKVGGFTPNTRKTLAVPLDQILRLLPNRTHIAIGDLKGVHLLPRRSKRFRVIGKGPGAKVVLIADGFSTSAKAALEQAGGTARRTPPRS